MSALAGQIGVLHDPPPHTFGALICAITDSTACHVVTAISETHCISPEWQGAIVRPITDFPGAAWSSFDYTPEQRLGVVNWACKRIGRPYAWLDDFVIGISRVARWPIPAWLGRIMSGDIWFMCSQFAATALWHGAGIRIFTNYPGETTPADVDNYLKGH